MITTDTGGISEAAGDCATIVPTDDPAAIAAALDEVTSLDRAQRSWRAALARAHAMQFDRAAVLDAILRQVEALPVHEAPRLRRVV